MDVGEGRMKACLAIIVCALLFTAGLSADDGSWNATYSLSEGSLYSETENKDIALEDEILAFDGFDSGLTRAAFFFFNTAGKSIVVQAGFPVRVRLELYEDLIPGTKDQIGLFFSQSKYGPEGDELEYARLVFGDILKTGKYPKDEYIEHSWEYFLPKDVPLRKELPAASIPDWFDFSISQDGVEVPCTTVVAEAALVSGAEFVKALDITFHFRHVLSFKAGEKSRVNVRYVSDCRSGGSNMGMFMVDSYSYAYILGTGRTWKGPIGRLYLAVPAAADPSLPGSFKRYGRMGRKDVYLALNYEPDPEDEISIGYARRGEIAASYLESIWFGERSEAELPKKPSQEFVTVLGASSFLKDTAAVYTEGGVILNAGFAPLSLFDGVRETAWCEGAKGDGIGEWVEFELIRDVEALDVQNGYNRSFTRIEGKNIDAYYELNNRPKTMEIVSADGKVKKTLSLRDTKEMQSFDKVFLPKGAYKLFVRDVFKGTKWQDTCIGEIIFHPASYLYQEFASDAFLKTHAGDISEP
jgi:hypothetical protein